MKNIYSVSYYFYSCLILGFVLGVIFKGYFYPYLICYKWFHDLINLF